MLCVVTGPSQAGVPAESPRSRRRLFPAALCTDAEAVSSVGLQEGSAYPKPPVTPSCQPDLPNSFHSSMILPNGQKRAENQAGSSVQIGEWGGRHSNVQ